MARPDDGMPDVVRVEHRIRLATPADIAPSQIVLAVRHPDFNARHLRLDGSNLAIDLRRELYGDPD